MSLCSKYIALMVEQTDACKRHGDAVFVAGFDDMVITYRTACLGDVFHAALVRTLDVVAEGEESIRA